MASEDRKNKEGYIEDNLEVEPIIIHRRSSRDRLLWDSAPLSKARTK